ncbi:MAG: RNA methyltransferase substrate-binding domain-containing protein, partial [Candidatus Dadabacteria bacterium]
MIIYGKNPIIELLSNPSSEIEELYISRNDKSNDASEILKTAKSRGIKTSSLTKE